MIRYDDWAFWKAALAQPFHSFVPSYLILPCQPTPLIRQKVDDQFMMCWLVVLLM